MKILGQNGLNFIANKFKFLYKKLNKKVDRVDGKGLSTNDFSNEAKTKVDNIPNNFKYIQHVTLTQAQYDALSSTQKNDPNIFYYIKK